MSETITYVRPSCSQRVLDCPWSYKNCLGWESPESEAASHGTLLHEAIHNEEVRNGLPEVDRSCVDAILTCIVNPLKEEGYSLFYEVPVEIKDWEGNFITQGTVDFVAISPSGTTAIVKDWKFGGKKVRPAKSNSQTCIYTVGVFQKFPTVGVVKVDIVQPLCKAVSSLEEQAVFIRTGNYDEMLDAVMTIDRLAKNATEANAHPSEDACQYCNRANCSAYKAACEMVAKEEAGKSALAIVAETATETAVIEDLDRSLCGLKLLQKFIDEKIEAISARIIENGGSEHFSVTKATVSKSVDWKAICMEMGVSEDAILSHTKETHRKASLRQSKKAVIEIDFQQ